MSKPQTDKGTSDNMAELNARSEAGRKAKKRPKTKKRNTVFSRAAQQAHRNLTAFLDQATAVHLVLDTLSLRVKVTPATRPILEAAVWVQPESHKVGYLRLTGELEPEALALLKQDEFLFSYEILAKAAEVAEQQRQEARFRLIAQGLLKV